MKTKPFPLVVPPIAIKSFLLTMVLVICLCSLAFAEQSQVQVSLSAAPEAQATPGSAIVFTASAQGESGVFEYQFWHKGPSTEGSWQIVSEYSASDSWTWQTSTDDLCDNTVKVKLEKKK